MSLHLSTRFNASTNNFAILTYFKLVLMNKMIHIAAFLCIMSIQSFYCQSFSNDEMNEFIFIENEENGFHELYVDPSRFDCACDSPILILFTPKSKNIYVSKDQNIKLISRGVKMKVKVKDASQCCNVKPGKYFVNRIFPTE